MAAIDKTYTDKEGLIEVIDWCLKVGRCKLENGYTFRPLNFVYGYNELDDNYRPIREQDTYVVWNTPRWFDRWLWLNCPIDFIKDRLLDQYGEDGVKEFEDFVNKSDLNMTKVKIKNPDNPAILNVAYLITYSK